MIIHTVKEGDTVFKIARQYGVSPLKIIENNALANPDALSVGEELLIVSPTRTYTVRGGDTQDRICRTFGIRRAQLQAANPGLLGTDKLYPGELLAIRYDTPRLGMAAVNGYVFRESTTDDLCRTLPYLTYVTVSAATCDGHKLDRLFDDRPYVRMAKDKGKIALLRIGEADGLCQALSDRARWEEVSEMITQAAREGGYGGITLSFFSAARQQPELYGEFIVHMRKRMLGCDLILFTETDANARLPLGDYADGNILLYDKSCLENAPSFEDGEASMAEHYASAYESARTFLDLSPFGYDGEESITLDDIRRVAYKYRSEIRRDDETGLCHVHYPKFSGGVRAEHEIVFESLENIKAKLHLVDEFGYMGVSVDVSRTPTAVFMMLYTLFCPASYGFATAD